jgi:predicted O-methyltransferase YrrM
MIAIPADLQRTIDEAWEVTKKVPGYLLENEARFLGVLAAIVPASGTIVEIGSYRGRSTVMLGKVAARYGLGPVVAIDPHNSPILLPAEEAHQPSSYTDFLASIREARLEQQVEPRLAYSREVSASWMRPIRLLWIDGDHSYAGAKTDFDEFFPHVAPNGVVALHDALNTCVGPIRVFVEDMLRSGRFGPAGFVHSIAWSQYRPADSEAFKKEREELDRRASRLIGLVKEGQELRGLEKMKYKLLRSRVPRFPLTYEAWAKQLEPA